MRSPRPQARPSERPGREPALPREQHSSGDRIYGGKEVLKDGRAGGRESGARRPV